MMGIGETDGFNKYEDVIEKVITNEKDLEISYQSMSSGSGFPLFGNIEINNVRELMGYAIALRNLDDGKFNFFVNDFLTFKEVQENSLEKIIKLNEKFAEGLNCSSITVEGGDSEIVEIYKKKGYNFENGSYIGVKKLK